VSVNVARPFSSRNSTNAARSLKSHCIRCAISLDLSGPNCHACRLCDNVEELANQNGFRSSTTSVAVSTALPPNYVSIADPRAINRIYVQKGGFLKGPFYEDNSQSYSLTLW
jgi:hypothetical protein